MANENLLPFDPNNVPDLIRQGKIRIVTTPTTIQPVNAVVPAERPRALDPMAERAKNVLGRDFLGHEAVLTMQNKLKTVGVNVEFGLDNVPALNCNEQDLQVAKQSGEMLVLRAAIQRLNGIEEQITVMNFRELFRQDPNKNIANLFYSFSPSVNDWYTKEDFAAKPGEIQLQWAFVKKEVLNGSTSKNWNQQDGLLKKYGEDLQKKRASRVNIGRRTGMEAVWDTMLYYTNTGQRLLDGKLDWTKSLTRGGHRVGVGGFDSVGLGVGYWHPGDSREYVGVCPSR